jgi:hypothetical protein
MGAYQAFLSLPQPWAVAELTRLIENKQYEVLTDALKALQGDVEQQLHIALSDCWAAIYARLDKRAREAADAAKAAAESGKLGEATKHELLMQSAAKKWSFAGKKDVLNELEVTHRELWAYQANKGHTWRRGMWQKAGLAWIPQSRGG